VIAVTGRPRITFEDHEDHVLWIELQGRRFRIPFAAAGVLHQSSDVTAYYTANSRMLVNLAPTVPAD
jgi:hypothetical protein